MNRSTYLRVLLVSAVLVFLGGHIAAQDVQPLTTADSFFATVSDKYQKIADYTVSMKITSVSGSKTETMVGRALFKKPASLRIDFSQPDEQTIVFTGDMLTIYLPGYNVVLSQSVASDSGGASGASLATPQGLSLLKRYYTIGYETSSSPVKMDETSGEDVIILTLARRSTTEMFRTIRLLISPDTLLIRRIDARTISGDQVIFDFTGYALNQGIPDNRFIYDSPASANTFNNFLFNE